MTFSLLNQKFIDAVFKIENDRSSIVLVMNSTTETKKSYNMCLFLHNPAWWFTIAVVILLPEDENPYYTINMYGVKQLELINGCWTL